MRIARLALAVIAMLLVTGCETQPATNVTDTSATLNARGACHGRYAGEWWYQIREMGASRFVDVGAGQRFACEKKSGVVDLDPRTATGLRPATTYEFRIRSRLSDGTVATFDSVGAKGGSVFDRFTTRPSATSGGVALDVPATDNYKACFNADPTVRELRTWLSMTSVTGGGRTWAARDGGVVIPIVDGEVLELRSADGATASLEVDSVTGPVRTISFRTFAGAIRTGVVTGIVGVDALKAEPIRLKLVLRSAGRAIGDVSVEYRYDPALAAALPGNPEYNGPSGRWYVDGVATPTDVEAFGAYRC